jgi:hypothetical protein
MAGLVLGVLLVGAAALPSAAAATVPNITGIPRPSPLPWCPAAGADSGCQFLIVVHANGTMVTYTDTKQPSYSGHGDMLVGFVNRSNALVKSVALAGVGGSKPFAFDGHGLCAVTPTPCSGPTANGPTGYEGPGTSFTSTEGGASGGVHFAGGGLAPHGSAYFTLASSKVAVQSSRLQADIAVTGQTFAASVGEDSSGTVATFTDGGSTAAPSGFAVTVDWGDGTEATGGTVSQPGGSGTPYVVTADHDFSGEGTFTTTIHVIDTSLTSNTGTGQGTADASTTTTSCTGTGCSGSVSTSQETVQESTTSTTGTITTSIVPDDGSVDCGDPFRHAPEITTVTDSGVGANIGYTITFDDSAAAGLWYVPFEVCYQSSPTQPFTDYYGNTGVTQGLLPFCATSGPVVAPCVQSITESPDPLGNPGLLGSVVEDVIIPPGDPKLR